MIHDYLPSLRSLRRTPLWGSSLVDPLLTVFKNHSTVAARHLHYRKYNLVGRISELDRTNNRKNGCLTLSRSLLRHLTPPRCGGTKRDAGKNQWKRVQFKQTKEDRRVLQVKLLYHYRWQLVSMVENESLLPITLIPRCQEFCELTFHTYKST